MIDKSNLFRKNTHQFLQVLIYYTFALDKVFKLFRKRYQQIIYVLPKKNKMKKLLLATFLFALVLSANAQIKFGLKAGINLPNFISNDANGNKLDSKMGFGFHVGGVLDYGLSESFSVQPGILFSSKGAKSSTPDTYTGKTLNETITINYIEIPLNSM